MIDTLCWLTAHHFANKDTTNILKKLQMAVKFTIFFKEQVNKYFSNDKKISWYISHGRSYNSLPECTVGEFLA